VLLKENAFFIYEERKIFFFLSTFDLYDQSKLLKVNFDDRLKMPFKVDIHKQAESRKYNLKFVILIVSDIVDSEDSANCLISISN